VVAKPADAEHGADAVCALAEHRGDVERVVHDALAEIGPTGVEVVVAYFAAVDVELVHPAGGGVEAGLPDGLADVDLLAEHGCGNVARRLPELRLAVAFGLVHGIVGIEQGVPRAFGDADVREGGVLPGGLREADLVEAAVGVRFVGAVVTDAECVLVGRAEHHHLRPAGGVGFGVADALTIDLNVHIVGVRAGYGYGDVVRGAGREGDVFGEIDRAFTVSDVGHDEAGRAAGVDSEGDVLRIGLAADNERGFVAAGLDGEVIMDRKAAAVGRQVDARRAYPPGLLPVAAEEAGFEPFGGRLAHLLLFVPQAYFPEVAGGGAQGVAGVLDVYGVGRRHAAGVVRVASGGQLKRGWDTAMPRGRCINSVCNPVTEVACRSGMHKSNPSRIVILDILAIS